MANNGFRKIIQTLRPLHQQKQRKGLKLRRLWFLSIHFSYLCAKNYGRKQSIWPLSPTPLPHGQAKHKGGLQQASRHAVNLLLHAGYHSHWGHRLHAVPGMGVHRPGCRTSHSQQLPHMVPVVLQMAATAALYRPLSPADGETRVPVFRPSTQAFTE